MRVLLLLRGSAGCGKSTWIEQNGLKPYTLSADDIVFEDGGISPIAYGASEKWFPTYDEAIKYAISIVRKRINEFKDCIDCNSVIVYEGGKELMRKSHSCPCGRVVFEWRNYHKER